MLAETVQATSVTQFVVYDNASADGIPAEVARRFGQDPRYVGLASPRNLGFGAACNAAAAQSSGDWLLFLNPDCRVSASTLDTLVARAGATDHPGVIGVTTLDPEGRVERAVSRLLPTCSRLLFGPRRTKLDRQRPWCPVEAGSGALMLVRRDLFERIGGFDPGFFLHAEDLDLMARARAAGAMNALAADLTAVHVQGGSSRARPAFVSWHKHRSLIRFLRLHPRHFGDRLLWPLLALAILAHAAYESLKLGLRPDSRRHIGV